MLAPPLEMGNLYPVLIGRWVYGEIANLAKRVTFLNGCNNS